MQIYSLVGNPVGYSLSSPIHETTHEEAGLDARYVMFELVRDDTTAAVEDVGAFDVSGLDVTILSKQDALGLVDPDPLTKRAGAVNTADFGGETSKGYNTDAAGVTRSFECRGVGLAGSSAVVVGAGGAGWAITFALADAGASVHVANRTAETAVELAAVVPGATGDGLDTLDRIREADALVNMTSAGMESFDETPISAGYLHGSFAILDAVYMPLETRLLCETAVAGAITINGAWTLLL